MPHHNWFRLRCTCLSLHISWILSVSSNHLGVCFFGEPLCCYAALQCMFQIYSPCWKPKLLWHSAPGIGKGDPLQQNGGNIQVIHAISSPSRKPHKCIQNNTKYTNTSIGGSEQHTRASNEKHNLQSTNQKLQFLLTLSHNMSQQYHVLFCGEAFATDQKLPVAKVSQLFALGPWLQHHLRPESTHRIGNMLRVQGQGRMVIKY